MIRHHQQTVRLDFPKRGTVWFNRSFYLFCHQRMSIPIPKQDTAAVTTAPMDKNTRPVNVHRSVALPMQPRAGVEVVLPGAKCRQ